MPAKAIAVATDVMTRGRLRVSLPFRCARHQLLPHDWTSCEGVSTTWSPALSDACSGRREGWPLERRPRTGGRHQQRAGRWGLCPGPAMAGAVQPAPST